MTITVNVNVRGAHGSKRCRRQMGDLTMAVQNLTEAVDRLTAAVDRVVAGGGGGGGVPQADVDVEAARVTEQAQRLEALPTPTHGNGESVPAAARHK